MSGVPVRIVEFSTVGARVEHEERFTLDHPQLEITCLGTPISMAVRIIRSEIVGRTAGKLSYRTGLAFTGDVLLAERVLSLLGADLAEPAAGQPAIPPPAQAEPAPVAPPPPAAATPSLDDSWTRRVNFLRGESDEELPYAQFQWHGDRWSKRYVATPEQPEEGFTLRSDDRDFVELQRAYEYADDETRRMMQIALRAKLEPVKV